jgi:hypothetical protein
MRSRSEQVDGDVGGGVEDVLAVVEHNEQPRAVGGDR